MEYPKQQLASALSDKVQKKPSEPEHGNSDHNGLLNLVLESLPHPFYVIDALDHKVILANSASRLDVLSDDYSCYEMTHANGIPCGSDKYPCPLEEIKRTKNHFVMEHIHYDQEGKSRNVEVHGFPVIDDKDRVSKIILYTLDITDRKKTEKALIESKDLYRDLYENAPTAYLKISMVDGSILQYNTAFINLLGYSRESISKMKIFDLYDDTLHKSFKLWEVFDELKNGQTVKDIELQVRHKDGHSIWISFSADPIKEAKGEVKEILSMLQNITDRKRAEEAIRESSEKIKLFAYSIAHDLKNPSVSLYGLTKRLYNNFTFHLDKKGLEYCARILEISEQIVALVDQINEFISTKELRLSIESLDIKNILKLIREEFSTLIENRNIHWWEPDHIPPIKGDKLSIIRALRNLIDNALKYGGDSLSEITIGYFEAADAHILSVKDNGIGIKEYDNAQIFNPFTRNKTSKDVHGSGLGLAIVKEIAEKHGGRVWIDRGQERGITIYLSIPKKPHNFR